MQRFPRISVVTSSYNQGAYIGRTIESVLAQNYPNLEHIVVDGMSSDETAEILARYGHLRVIREPDEGQADAINKGFRIATGDILCFLNSDDTLLPGALHRVAQEIDPARGRHVVLGRCRFVDEHDSFIGVEHPSSFESHRRVLEIWKGYCIPQPAVFWTPEVWQRCGPLNEHERLMLDYDLFCRFSKEYTFHFVDQVLATYRMHSQSKTSSVTDEQRLEQAIQVSRRYWGAPSSAQFWQILLSYGAFRLDRRRRAVALLRQGRESWRRSQRLRTLPYLVGGALLAPDVVGDVLLLPLLKPRLQSLLQKRMRLKRWVKPSKLAPQTLAWRDFVSLHADSWAGPTFITEVDTSPDHTLIELAGSTGGFRMPSPLEVNLYLDDRHVHCEQVGRGQTFALSVPLGDVAPGRHELKVVSSTFVVPHDYMGIGDYRPLSFKLTKLKLT